MVNLHEIIPDSISLGRFYAEGSISFDEWNKQLRLSIRLGNLRKYGSAYLVGLDPLPGEPPEWRQEIGRTGYITDELRLLNVSIVRFRQAISGHTSTGF